MDCGTGKILHLDEKERVSMEKHYGRKLLPLSEDEVSELRPLNRPQRKNKMRNKPCVCGSGKKFKRCCWSKYQ